MPPLLSKHLNCHMILKATHYRAGKIRFSGERKFVLLKASSGDRCAPHNFVLPVTLRSKSVCLTIYLTVHQIK